MLLLFSISCITVLISSVEGDAVSIQSAGDSVSMDINVYNVEFWNFSWKACLSLGKVELPNSPPVVDYGTDDVLMLLGSHDSGDGSVEVIEKVGIGVSTTDAGITSLEMVQTRRDVATGALGGANIDTRNTLYRKSMYMLVDIWISDELTSFENDEFMSCVERQKEASGDAWKVTVESSSRNVIDFEVSNSLSLFEPKEPKIVIEKLRNGTSYTVKDYGVYGDCVQTMDYGMVCNSVVSSLTYSDHVVVEGSDVAVHSDSACNGGGILFYPPDWTNVAIYPEISGTTGPTALCFTVRYQNNDLPDDGYAKLYFLGPNGEKIARIDLLNSRIGIQPYIDPPIDLFFDIDEYSWHTICIGFADFGVVVVADDDLFVDNIGRSIEDKFDFSGPLKIRLGYNMPDGKLGVPILLTDVNVYKGWIPTEMPTACDFADNHADMLFKWRDRTIVPVEQVINIKTRPNSRRMVQMEAPLVVWGSTVGSMGISDSGSCGAHIGIGKNTTSFNDCYLDAEFTCDFLIDSSPTTWSSLCWSTTGVNAEIYNSSYYVGSDVVASINTMMYKNYHVMPSLEYSQAPDDNVTYSIADDASHCVDSFNGSTLIAYNYMTKVCQNISVEGIVTKDIVQSYYSTLFLLSLEFMSEPRSKLFSWFQDFQETTQYQFSMDDKLCVNGKPFYQTSGLNMTECGRLCLLYAECEYFQAALYKHTGCALFSYDYFCGDDSDSYLTNGTLWNNPYLKRFNKKECYGNKILIYGECVERSRGQYASEELYTIESVFDSQVASALSGSYSESVRVRILPSIAPYAFCNETTLPGYYPMPGDILTYCDQQGTKPTAFFPGLLGHEFARLERLDGTAVELSRSTNIMANPLFYPIRQDELFTFPLLNWGFHHTVYDSRDDSHLSNDVTITSATAYVNQIELYVWLYYAKFSTSDGAEKLAGTVINLGEWFRLSVEWDTNIERIRYTVEVGENADGDPLRLSTSHLPVDTWLMVHVQSRPLHTIMHILDKTGTIIQSVQEDNGLNADRYYPTMLELKFRGYMTCLTLFYNQASYSIPLHMATELCVGTDYKFADQFKSMDIETVNHQVSATNNNAGTLLSIDSDVVLGYLGKSPASNIPTICSGYRHVTAFALPRWKSTTDLKYNKYSIFSVELFDLANGDVTYDRIVCEVSYLVDPGMVHCWELLDPMQPTSGDSSIEDPCSTYSKVCSYLIITLRDERVTSDWTDEMDLQGTTTMRRVDCMDRCFSKCNGTYHWAKVVDESHMPSLDGFLSEACSCILSYDQQLVPSTNPKLGLKLRSCNEVCPNLRVVGSRTCDCDNGNYTETRVCSDRSVLIGEIFHSSCQTGSTVTISSKKLCKEDFCPTSQYLKSICRCNDNTQLDVYYCDKPSITPSYVELKNQVCSQYETDFEKQMSPSNCSTMCPAMVDRPCCNNHGEETSSICSHDETTVQGITLTNIGCISEASCNTDCLNILYQVDCTSGAFFHNTTGTFKVYQDMVSERTQVCSSECDDFPNWKRLDKCQGTDTESSRALTTVTSNPTTTTPNHVTTPTSAEHTTTTTTTTTAATTTAVPTSTSATTTTASTPTATINSTTASWPATTPTSSKTYEIITNGTQSAMLSPTTAALTTPNTSAAAATTTTINMTPATTPTVTTTVTTTTTRPETYMGCSCKDGTLYDVLGGHANLIPGNCSSACPYWSLPVDHCYCSANPILQYTRTCMEGNSGNGYILDRPFLCDPGDIETKVTTVPCICPETVEVDQCDCKSGYGRIGVECHYHHPRPIGGVCSINDVNPYVCKQKCSRHGEWNSWSTCTPCGIGNENGTHTRSRDCIPPANYDTNTDYMGSEICTTTDKMTSDCSCGYIWSQWGSCDCSSGKQQRIRCPASLPKSVTKRLPGDHRVLTTSYDSSLTATSTALVTESSNSNIIATNITASNVTASNITASNITPTSVTATSAMATNVTATNVMATNVTATSVMATNVTATSAMATNVTATSFMATNVTATSVMATNVTATSVMATNVTATNVMATNVTATSVMATNVTATSVMTTNITATSVIATNVTATSVMATNVTASNFTTTNFTASNITAHKTEVTTNTAHYNGTNFNENVTNSPPTNLNAASTTGINSTTTNPITAISTSNVENNTAATIATSNFNMATTDSKMSRESITRHSAASTPENSMMPAWCISERECSVYCPHYSTEWSEWEKCNCLENRRFQECIYPNNPDGMNFTAPLCTEPLKETKGCNDPGCYSDWSEWSQCPCDVSQSSRTRECLDNICSEPLKEYQDCQLNELICWQPWSTWSTCLRADNNCGRGGIKNRTRTADCSSTPNLSDICPTKTQTQYNKSCISYTCTKYGEWGEWEEWNGVKLCGRSNQTRDRNCEYSYRSIQSWSESTCDVDCWQCIVDESEARCQTEECRNKSCYRDKCMRSCLHNGGNITEELNLTFKCRDPETDGTHIDNVMKGRREVLCGTGNTWTEWTACGITCGNQWGKRYRSQKCDLTEDEKISELCKNVLFLQVEPEWCFGKGKCPAIKVVPTLIPQERKAKNLPPKEGKLVPEISAPIFFASLSVLMIIIVLDFPFLISQVRGRLLPNIRSRCCKKSQ